MNGVVALVVGGVSLLLNIVGLAIPYWLNYSATVFSVKISTHLGLWQICISDSCTGISGDAAVDSLKATRAMEILGMLLLIAAIVCAVLKLAVMKAHTFLPKIAAGWAFAAGIFMFIGCIIFVAKFKKDNFDPYDLHAGFALCIVAGVGSIVAGVLFVLAKD